MLVRFRNAKGIDDFIRLAEELPQITFIWAGGFSFGGMTDGYERYKNHGKSPRKSDFSWYCIARADARIVCPSGSFLLPSYNELFPMTILEAAEL